MHFFAGFDVVAGRAAPGRAPARAAPVGGESAGHLEGRALKFRRGEEFRPGCIGLHHGIAGRAAAPDPAVLGVPIAIENRLRPAGGAVGHWDDRPLGEEHFHLREYDSRPPEAQMPYMPSGQLVGSPSLGRVSGPVTGTGGGAGALPSAGAGTFPPARVSKYSRSGVPPPLPDSSRTRESR